MGTKSPLNTLSRKVAQAPERTPGFEAMFSDSGVVPTTWGNLASHLVEEGIVEEPTTEAVCDFLGITPEDLADSKVIFKSRDDVETFLDKIELKYMKEFDTLFLDKAQGQMYQVLGERAPELHLQMRQKIKEAEGTEDRQARARLMAEMAGLRSELGDLDSSYETSLYSFIEDVLSYQGPVFFDEPTLISALGELAYSIRIENPNMADRGLRNIPIFRREAGVFIKDLRWSYESRRTKYARGRARRGELENILYAQPYWEHSLFTGDES